jgi:hypothetical protein
VSAGRTKFAAAPAAAAVAAVAVVAVLLFAPGCSSTDDSGEEELYLPTEAEAQAKAAKSISDDNADEEYERLMEEIEAGK